jgi:CO/xanthine dehydrogenase Mo-binding subunit
VPAPPERRPGSARAGLNRVSTQALTSLAQAAAAAELGIRPSDVRADWSDDAGLLALRIVAPIAIPDLADPAAPQSLALWGGSVWERCAAAKGRILDSVAQLSGTALSRVDLRISGMRAERSVRAHLGAGGGWDRRGRP